MPVVYLAGFVVSVYFLFQKKAYRKGAVFICVGSAAALCFWCAEYFGQKDFGLSGLVREKKGGVEKTVKLEAEADGCGEKELLTVRLAPQAYTEEELSLLAGELWQYLEQEMLSGNVSMDCVTEDMYFPERVDEYPFLLKWSSDAPALLSAQGKLGEEIPQSGKLVEIRVRISHENTKYEEEHILYARLFPSKESGAFWNRLEKKLKEYEEKTRKDAAYELPGQFEGRTLRFREKKNGRSGLLFLLFVVGGAAVIAGERQEAEKRKQKRKKEIEEEYPEMVSRMAMLVGAGMTISGAFKRIAGEYGRRRQKKEKPLYEEMLTACREMESGISERAAYQNMGTRCGVPVIVRFTALLIQYMQSGAAGLKKALREESGQALKERKERAQRLGEEAGTKLLLPMTLILMLVMALIMIPAFTSFG